MNDIEVFTVCVDYDDYLEITLFYNRKLFNNWLIITSPEDTATKQLCKKYNVRCIESNRIYEDGALFNKGKALNDGIKHLRGDWLLHIDADIILPSNLLEIINKMELNSDYLYCVRRKHPLNISDISLDKINLFAKMGDSTDLFEPSKEQVRRDLFLGYFQLFNIKSRALYDKEEIYPEHCHSAARYDRIFSHYWQTHERKVIEGIEILHLPHGVRENWYGRKSLRLDIWG